MGQKEDKLVCGSQCGTNRHPPKCTYRPPAKIHGWIAMRSHVPSTVIYVHELFRCDAFVTGDVQARMHRYRWPMPGLIQVLHTGHLASSQKRNTVINYRTHGDGTSFIFQRLALRYVYDKGSGLQPTRPPKGAVYVSRTVGPLPDKTCAQPTHTYLASRQLTCT